MKIFQHSIANLPPIPEATRKNLVRHFQKVLFKHGYNMENHGASGLASYMATRYADAVYENYRPSLKGLMILGNTGTGKTFAMEYLADFFKEMCGIRMEIISASDIARIYAADGDDGFWRWFCDKKSEELIIDDLGAERNAKHFGNGGIMPEVISKRYDTWRGSGVRTHFTSNLDLTAIKSRYGERITSRLAEMITLMTIAGKDYRMAPPVNKNAKDASEDGQSNIVEKNAVSVEFQKQEKTKS